MNSFLDRLNNKLKRVWEESGKMSKTDTPDIEQAWMRLESSLDSPGRKYGPKTELSWTWTLRRPRVAIAAAILLFLILTPIVFEWFNSVTVKTDRMEEIQVTLPGGSTVKLNSDSRLTYGKSFDRANREVFLEGEAYFNVRPDSIPFMVITDEVQVKVIGTEFNVKARQEGIEIVVNKGRVQVHTQIDKRDSTITISKGQYSTFQQGEFPTPPAETPFHKYPGWIFGNLSLYQTDIKSVCREIERKFDVEIELAGQELESITVTGIIEAESLDTVLSTLSLLIQRKYRIKDEKYIIY